ncbi:MAG: DUF72 domain-containing protein [Phormidesmis sp.]
MDKQRETALGSLELSASPNFLMGCAVWAFKDWVGSFYPEKSQATNFLRLYGERLWTVEGNTTFYSVPAPEMVQRWVNNTPDGFQFCPKLPRAVTHEGALMARLPEALSFLDLMKGLGDRLGPIMVQLPPSYSPASIADLAEFLTVLTKESVSISVEVRHLDWFKNELSAQLNALLMRLGVGRVLLDTRSMYDWEHEGDADPQLSSNRRKPRVPLLPVITSDYAIVRYISHPKLLRNHDYLASWVAQVDQWLKQGKRIYFFVHCPREEESPAIAQYFQGQLEAANVPVPPLPWNQLAKPPDQLSLF